MKKKNGSGASQSRELGKRELEGGEGWAVGLRVPVDCRGMNIGVDPKRARDVLIVRP